MPLVYILKSFVYILSDIFGLRIQEPRTCDVTRVI